MTPTHPAMRAWALLSGTRLTSFCLAFWIVLWLVAETAGFWARWHERLGALSSLMDPAKWSIPILAILVLNLLCATVNGLRPSQSKASTGLGSDSEDLLRAGLETHLSPDAFGSLVREWGRQALGKLSSGPSGIDGAETGTEALSASRGRTSSWLRGLAHWALVVAAAGAVSLYLRGFQAKAIVEEGMRARALEWVRGPVPDGWKRSPDQPGRRGDPTGIEPGFEIERAAASSEAPVGSSVLHFYRGDRLESSLTVSPGGPARFEGLSVHLLRYVPGSSYSVRLAVTERATGKERKFAALARDERVGLESFAFRVTEIRPETDDRGASVEIEYREAGREPQRFWVFADHPDYDFAHRKKSQQYFTLEGLRLRNAAEIAIGQEPGAELLWGGLLAAAALFWLALARPEERVWIRWKPGAAAPMSVELIGWSARPLFFERRFYRLAAQLEERINEAESPSEAHDAGSGA
jgi:hypothetical protein